MSTSMWIIIAGAMMTYLTRVGGHLVLSRFKRVHPRVDAALNAVPAAVLTTLVAPATLSAGPAEFGALAVAALVSLRRGMLVVFLSSAAALLLLRQFMN